MPVSFIETPRFPDDLAAWAEGGPGYSTSIVVVDSGYEQRNANWAQARGNWDISSGLRKQSDVAAAVAFFRAMKGRAYGFRFKDFHDFSATVANGAFDATATANVFQAVKVYTTGSLFERRWIRKPVVGTFAMYNSAVLMVVGGGAGQYTIDTTTGLVTLGSGYGSVSNYTWSGEFDVPVRFDVDEMRGAREAQGGFYQWAEIPLIEIRV